MTVCKYGMIPASGSGYAGMGTVFGCGMLQVLEISSNDDIYGPSAKVFVTLLSQMSHIFTNTFAEGLYKL